MAKRVLEAAAPTAWLVADKATFASVAGGGFQRSAGISYTFPFSEY
jgi:hypothetical protein